MVPSRLAGYSSGGDIDVDAIEALIKKRFSDIPAQPNAAKREYYPVNDNQEPIRIGCPRQRAAICTDLYLQQASSYSQRRKE